ncbi:MAG: hypothetical protein AB7F99_05095 [Vicinamibacterales bacterium]
MLTTPTTFVLGAGASKPYGMPLASEVKDYIGGLKPRAEEYRLLLSSGVDPHELNDLIDDVRGYPLPSFDSYLEMRKSDAKTIEIGTAVLAATIGKAISHASGRAEIGQDWIAYVVRQMLEGAATCRSFAEGNAKVAFITFNFGWILEARLRELLSRAYSSHDDVQTALDSLQVLHMHGRLPALDGLVGSPMFDSRSGRVHPGWCQWLNGARQALNVTSDAISASTLHAAQAHVAGSRVLCFLGFGYHADNLRQLNIPAGLPATLPGQHSIFGSAYGCFHGERERIKSRLLNRIVLGGQDMGCLDVLRSLDVFQECSMQESSFDLT